MLGHLRAEVGVCIVVRVGTCVQRWAWALLCAWALACRGWRGHCRARGHLRAEVSVGIVVRVSTCVQRLAWALSCAWALACRGWRGHCCAHAHLRAEERIDAEMLGARKKRSHKCLGTCVQRLACALLCAWALACRGWRGHCCARGHLRAEVGVGIVVRVGTCVQRLTWALLCAFTL
jgi:hypothetical protein